MSDHTCTTKYPIMLIHGIGYTDYDFNRYWGRIPDFLRNHGAEIYFGGQDAFGSIEANAAQLKVSAENVLKQSGAEKLNLIAHSKGGIEARYMITKLGMSEKTASLSTLATPHRGIISMDRTSEKAGPLYRCMIRIFNLMLNWAGGQKNRSVKLYEQLTADYMGVFNQLVPDAENVYYQSYAFDMKNGKSDPAMSTFYRIIRRIEGANDGLVSVASARWGDFRGVYSGPGTYGISHPAAADSRQIKGSGEKTGGGLLDITDLYWDIACRLKSMGY